MLVLAFESADPPPSAFPIRQFITLKCLYADAQAKETEPNAVLADMLFDYVGAPSLVAFEQIASAFGAEVCARQRSIQHELQLELPYLAELWESLLTMYDDHRAVLARVTVGGAGSGAGGEVLALHDCLYQVSTNPMNLALEHQAANIQSVASSIYYAVRRAPGSGSGSGSGSAPRRSLARALEQFAATFKLACAPFSVIWDQTAWVARRSPRVWLELCDLWVSLSLLSVQTTRAGADVLFAQCRDDFREIWRTLKVSLAKRRQRDAEAGAGADAKAKTDEQEHEEAFYQMRRRVDGEMERMRCALCFVDVAAAGSGSVSGGLLGRIAGACDAERLLLSMLPHLRALQEREGGGRRRYGPGQGLTLANRALAIWNDYRLPRTWSRFSDGGEEPLGHAVVADWMLSSTLQVLRDLLRGLDRDGKTEQAKAETAAAVRGWVDRALSWEPRRPFFENRPAAVALSLGLGPAPGPGSLWMRAMLDCYLSHLATFKSGNGQSEGAFWAAYERLERRTLACLADSAASASGAAPVFDGLWALFDPFSDVFSNARFQQFHHFYGVAGKRTRK